MTQSSRHKRAACLTALVAVAMLPGSPAHAKLVDGTGLPLALQPTYFSETDAGTENPSVTFQTVPSYGSLTISYGAYFAGMAYSFDPANPPPIQTGDATNSPLSLTSDKPLEAIVLDDGNAPNSPVVGGSFSGFNAFIGPVAILFSVPVAGVELTVGSFDAIGITAIEAFTAAGSSLGSVTNSAIGYETFALSDSLGAGIAGLALRSTILGGDPGGYGVAGVGIFAPPIPAPIPAPPAWPFVLFPGLARLCRNVGHRRGERAGRL